MNVHCILYKGVTEILAKMYSCPNFALNTQNDMTNAEATKELFSKIIQRNLDLHSSFSIFIFWTFLF